MEAKEIIIEIPCPSPGSPLIAQNLSSLNSQLIRYKPQICDDSQEFDGIKTEREIGVPVLIFLLSLCAIFFNAIAWYGVSKSKIFGKSYGIMMRMRSSVEIVAALITFGFFGTHVFFGYSVDIWMNAALTTFYVFLLSNAYLLHYAISINRLVSIYFPMRYADIFEEKKCVFVVVALILIFSSIISSLSFTDRCSYFVFSKELYDIVPVGCKDVKSSKISNHIVVIIWAVCAFSSLVLDVITLLRIAVYSRKAASVHHNHGSIPWTRNVRFFLQTFIVNLIICAGAIAVQVASERFESNDTRFFFALFQVLLGFVCNGLVPLVVNKELRNFVSKQTPVTTLSTTNSSRTSRV